MTAFDLETIQSALERHRHLEESLLLELHLVHHGYSVELAFAPWAGDQSAATRASAERPLVVTFRLDGVSSLEIVGGLTDTMLANPDKIDWGLSEVAVVEVDDIESAPCLRVLWEGERRIIVHFRSAVVIE